MKDYAKYALAKFIDVAGGVDARKRLQKCIYLIQTAGCDLGAKYRLHFYGPYSWDVAEATNELTSARLLKERSKRTQRGEQYSYRVTAACQKLLREYEASAEGRKALKHIEPFFNLFRELREVDLWKLELAATIAYYRADEGRDWPEGREQTAGFKQIALDARILAQAEELARKCVARDPVHK